MTIYTSRFARTLCSLYTSGMSIVNALNIAKTTIGNVYIESQFDGAIKKLRNGESLSQAIKDIDGFDIKLTSSIFVGEEVDVWNQCLQLLQMILILKQNKHQRE